MFNGKIHYFDWAIFNSKLLNNQRVQERSMVLKHEISPHGPCIDGMSFWRYHPYPLVNDGKNHRKTMGNHGKW